MGLQSLPHLLNSISSQESWRGRRQFQMLVSCWPEIVGQAVAAQTRPTGIQRQVLQVATASSAWAQNLAFERHTILAKLNAKLGPSPGLNLGLELSDIRFSTAQWQSESTGRAAGGNAEVENFSEAAILWRDHPSRVQPVGQPVSQSVGQLGGGAARAHPARFGLAQTSSAQTSSAQAGQSGTSRDPQTAFRNWARAVRIQAQHLPLCPTCQIPAPPGELQRWGVCAPCAVKQFVEAGRPWGYSQPVEPPPDSPPST
jgi:predicted nucleic acid-binding Zn ribbon protein